MTHLTPTERNALWDRTEPPSRWFSEYLTDLFTSADHVPSFPVKVLWEIEGRCNLECEHCWAGTTTGVDDPPVEQKLAVADEIVQGGAEVVSFSGGEPLLSPDLRPLVERLTDGGVRVQLLTNGELVERNIDWLASCLGPTDEVQVSIDGPPSVHERQRHGSRFNELLTGIRLLRDNNISVRANFTATPINLESLPEVLGICAREDVEPLSVLPVYPVSDGIELWERFSTAEYLKTVATCAVDPPVELDVYLPIEAFELLDPPVEPPTDDETVVVPLPEGRSLLQIQADGGIYPGPKLAKPAFRAGSITDTTLSAAWNGDTWDTLREGRRLTNSKCADCPYRGRCGGGNTARVFRLYEAIDHADPFCDVLPSQLKTP